MLPICLLENWCAHMRITKRVNGEYFEEEKWQSSSNFLIPF
ncbi:hypothetical protein FM109_06560 [Vibrio casei]|nr:hypothetical protein FM109_06560 [Vibrio casei]